MVFLNGMRGVKRELALIMMHWDPPLFLFIAVVADGCAWVYARTTTQVGTAQRSQKRRTQPESLGSVTTELLTARGREIQPVSVGVAR